MVGAFIGRQVSPMSWIGLVVGLLVGGIVGYLSFEWKRVAATYKGAWNQASTRARAFHVPDEILTDVKALVRLFPTSLVYGTTLVTPAVLVAYSGIIRRGLDNGYRLELLMFGIFLVGASVARLASEVSDMSRNGKSEKEIRAMFLRCNPFRIYLRVAPVVIWMLLQLVFQWAWRQIRITPHFLKLMVIATYSDVRLLCGICGAIGAAVGYLSHSAIISALVGGCLGALNFEVLSIRVFKLVPQSKSIFSW